MIFPSQDRVLLTQELGTYGVTYTDTWDCLVIAPGLKGHPGWVGAVSGVPSPLETMCLLSLDDEVVGVLFPWVSQLINNFWNSNLPEEIPAEHLVDMLDLCLAEVRSQNIIDDLLLCQTSAMQHYARELMRESGSLPRIILERMRENIAEFKETVH